MLAVSVAVPDVTGFLQHVTGFGFGVVGLLAVIEYLRRRDRESAYLALALGLFGAVSVMGEGMRDLGWTRADGSSSLPGPLAAAVGLLNLALFMGCGYALLLFRHALLPVRRWVLWAVAVVLAAVVVLVLPFTFDTRLAKTQPLVYLALILVLFGVWCGCVGEPVYRMWRVSRQRPAVQRARLRAVALGYGVIIVVLLLVIGFYSTSAGKPIDPNSPTNQVVSLVVEVVILFTLPILYVSFAPPRWLRRAWRAGEEQAFSEALHDLLLESPNSSILADRALAWAVRLVGAEGGIMLDARGDVLARRGSDELVEAAAGKVRAALEHGARPPGPTADGSHTMTVPLSLAAGTGAMVVVAGALTPSLGGEESVRLSQYAVSVAAALDRVGLVETVRRSEEELRTVNRELEDRVRRRTSELEVSNRELQASNRELEAFSYTVSHDLRSPLRAIDGFTRILGEEHAKDLNADAQRYLGLVAENARAMGNLIDTMLTFSRMGRQVLTLQPVDPADVARRVAERIQVDNQGRNLHFEVEAMPECQSDPVLLEQVYSNLLGNAAKFTRQRDEARVTVGAMPDPEDSSVTAYYVRDNGVGFDPRYAHKLFGVFQRLHRAEEFEGYGAGLAIVERIVTRHGGRVWAEGTPGEGAAFYFTLKAPAAGKPTAAGEPSTEGVESAALS